jgi:hypothetical protein
MTYSWKYITDQIRDIGAWLSVVLFALLGLGGCGALTYFGGRQLIRCCASIKCPECYLDCFKPWQVYRSPSVREQGVILRRHMTAQLELIEERRKRGETTSLLPVVLIPGPSTIGNIPGDSLTQRQVEHFLT